MKPRVGDAMLMSHSSKSDLVCLTVVDRRFTQSPPKFYLPLSMGSLPDGYVTQTQRIVGNVPSCVSGEENKTSTVIRNGSKVPLQAEFQ